MTYCLTRDLCHFERAFEGHECLRFLPCRNRKMILSFNGITPQIASTAYIAPSADIIGDVEIGGDSSVWFGTVIRGDVHFIRIGTRTSIQDISMLHVTRKIHPLIQKKRGQVLFLAFSTDLSLRLITL